MRHEPVMLQEVVQHAASITHAESTDAGSFRGLDVTLGLGGHTTALLDALPSLTMFALDQDNSTRLEAIESLIRFGSRFSSAHASFSEISQLETLFHQSEELSFDFVLADLGISSVQLDTPERGFSFRFDAPLDMRMDQSKGVSAADVLNTYSEGQLLRVFSVGGVRKGARSLVKSIMQSRPVMTTKQFQLLCEKALPYKKGADPATVPFQALRIEVNGEFRSLTQFLQGVLERLAPGARLLIIGFHSTEDLIVARAMRWWSSVRGKGLHPEDAPLGELLSKDAMLPSEEEIERNPRSRSARLRIFQRNNTELWKERAILPDSLRHFLQ